jgi:SAM-dependent methyltransferase
MISQAIAEKTWEDAVEWLRAQPTQQEFVRQCYYDDPVIVAAARFCASEEWAAICELLADALPGKVLELGAGRGIVSYAFACIGCEVTALEPDASKLVGQGAIAELSAHSPRPIEILAEWGERIPAADASYDIVFCRCVLHHARNLPQLCQEVFRVLKPGGVFLAEREHVIDKREDLQEFLDKHPLHHLYGGENAFLLAEYQQAITQAGLKLKRSIPPFHHLINFVPPMSNQRLDTMTREALAKLLPQSLANSLGRYQWMRNLYARSLSWRCRVPGRFYSFLAYKPA